MLSGVSKMRYGEWWASLPDLRGSWHPYLLLPTTHLADFLSARRLSFTGVYWVDVDGFFDVEGPSSGPDNLLFLSVPPRYFLPVMLAASCLAHTLYKSCIFRWVVPLLKILLILNVQVAASKCVRLFIFLSFSDLDVGSGIIRSSTLSSCSSGSSLVLPGVSVSMKADVALTRINGLAFACNTAISCLGFSFPDNQLMMLQADASSECAASNDSNSSLIRTLSSFVNSSASSIISRTQAASGISWSGSKHSNVFSFSSVDGQMQRLTLSLMDLHTASGSAASIPGTNFVITCL